ncbi:hypothetical protein [Luteimonas huabeiensis]|uniref:hypothetical protein n=1 Tax=Luteimonas huabeiensis TaxID=1244513 RepID=UPI0004B96022|nr:hypothetical protein [Luteimonas huabeiensis]
MARNMALRIALACAPAAICAHPIATAAPPASHACAEVARAAERLACYDRAFPPSEAARHAAAELAREDFGLPDRTGAPAAEPVPERIEARVTRVTYADGGRRVVTLDNGQTWATTEGGSRGHVAEGDSVSVRTGALGGYLLRTPAGVSLRVRRVR